MITNVYEGWLLLCVLSFFDIYVITVLNENSEKQHHFNRSKTLILLAQNKIPASIFILTVFLLRPLNATFRVSCDNGDSCDVHWRLLLGFRNPPRLTETLTLLALHYLWLFSLHRTVMSTPLNVHILIIVLKALVNCFPIQIFSF